LGYEKKDLWKEMLDSKYGGWRDLRNQRKYSSDSMVEGLEESVGD